MIHLMSRTYLKNDQKTAKGICGKRVVVKNLTQAASLVDCQDCIALSRQNAGSDVEQINTECNETEPCAKDLTDQLDQMNSFAAKIRYMDMRFPRLGCGTGRRVYDIGQGKVLKLSINAKGQAQNEVEADRSMGDWYADTLPKVYDASPDNAWIVVDKATPVTKKCFMKTFNRDMETVFLYIESRIDPHAKNIIDKNDEAFLDGNEWLQELLDCIVNFDLMFRDICRKGAWGKVGDRLVIRDYGLSRYVWEEYYKPVKVNGTRYVYGEKTAKKFGK